MKLQLKQAATSQILQVFVADSSSTTGAGLTGLAFNSGSLTAYYHKDGDTTATAITLATMTVGTYTSGGFKEIDATNMPGWYQFCPPNAAISSGNNVAFHLKGATNMAPLPIEVQLVSYDPYDAAGLGLSRLDAAVSTRSTYAGGAVASVTAPVTVGTNNDKTGYSLATSITIKKNTALASFPFQLFDSAGAAKTGATVTAQKSLDGGALSACTNSATEIGNGLYKIDLTAAELNPTNSTVLRFSASGAIDCVITIFPNA